MFCLVSKNYLRVGEMLKSNFLMMIEIFGFMMLYSFYLELVNLNFFFFGVVGC